MNQNQSSQLDIAILMEEYKKELSKFHNDNIFQKTFIRQLENKVEELEKKVQSLEKQLDEVSTTVVEVKETK